MDDNIATRTGDPEGEFPPDATRRAGDQYRFACEFICHVDHLVNFPINPKQTARISQAIT